MFVNQSINTSHVNTPSRVPSLRTTVANQIGLIRAYDNERTFRIHFPPCLLLFALFSTPTFIISFSPARNLAFFFLFLLVYYV